MEKDSPTQPETVTMLVNGEPVEVSLYITVREIRASLPPHLVDEFNEMVETTPADRIKFYLHEWGLPTDKLLQHRRSYAETLYRSVHVDPFNVEIPDGFDVDEVIRNLGYLTEKDAGTGSRYKDGKLQ